MRTGFLGALGVWLAGVGLALAQPAPQYQPARGFYYPMAPGTYPANGMLPQQPGNVYSQPMIQPGYPMQGYPMQGYPQPMYYPQARPMAPAAMPVQWVRPVGMTPPALQAAPYTISGPTVVPNRTPLMPPAEDAAVASEPVLPQAEAEKKLQPETSPPPMLPSAGSPISTASPAPHAPVVVEHDASVFEADPVAAVVQDQWKKKKAIFGKKGSKKETACDADCDTCDPVKEKKKRSLWGKKDKKDKECKVEVQSDDPEGAFGPDPEPAPEKKHRFWGKKEKKGECTEEGCPDSESCESGTPRFWFAADYLAWKSKKGRLDTPLVTSGTSAVLGGNLDYDIQQGGRLRTGYVINDCWGLETSGFALFERDVSRGVSSDITGAPALSRPLVDGLTGLPVPFPVSLPGVATGAVTLNSSSRLYGGDVNLARTLCCKDHLFVSLLAGFRYLRLEEDLTINQSTRSLTGTTDAVLARDFVDDENTFYGGQLGVSSGLQIGRLYVGATGKAALGTTQELSRSEGATIVTAAGARVVGPALLVDPGRHYESELSYVSEGQLEFGYQITPHINAMLGWNILYWNHVARPGDQLSNVIGRPAQDVISNSFWTQGVNASLGIRF